MTEEIKTPRDVINETIEVARELYGFLGYESKPGFKFWESRHPQEKMVWAMACAMMERFTYTDVDDAFTELECDEGEVG